MTPDLLGWLASAVFLSRLVPQPARLLRTGVPDGVSPMSAMNCIVTDLGWIAYGLLAGLVPVWVVGIVSLFPGVLFVVLLLRRTTLRDLLGSAIWTGVIIAAWAIGALGAVLAISVVVNNGPQVWVAVRERNLVGLAPTTWLIAIADALLWGAYGVATGDGALIGYGVVLLVSALVILGRIRLTRDTAHGSPDSPISAGASAQVAGDSG
ncbi:MAG: hypothetical protein M5T61_06685 [Acidimicrobiia bacterium]|nr:hypothetical protein [Acidimicrobiia bacterium]